MLYLSQDSHQELYTFIQRGSVLSVLSRLMVVSCEVKEEIPCDGLSTNACEYFTRLYFTLTKVSSKYSSLVILTHSLNKSFSLIKCVNNLAFYNYPTTVLLQPTSNNIELLNPLICPRTIQ